MALTTLSIDLPKVAATPNNYWLHLDGIEYDGEAAHLTITPGPDKEMDWKYFHFSPVRFRAKHAFYELLDQPEEQFSGPDLYIRRSMKTVDKDKKLVTRSESKTSSEDLPGGIDADVNLLIMHIAKTRV